MPKHDTKPANRKDAKIGELQLELDEANERIEELEERAEAMEITYNFRHSTHNKDPWGDGKLPLPRIQMHYEPHEPGNWYNFDCVRSLVMRHYLGHILVVPLGITAIGSDAAYRSGGPFEFGGKLYDPWREGCHFRSDVGHLKLPGFKVHGDVIQPVMDYFEAEGEMKASKPLTPNPEPLGDGIWPPRFGPEAKKNKKVVPKR